jgi:hypothetical protein
VHPPAQAAACGLLALLSCAEGAPLWRHVVLGYAATLCKEPAAAFFAVFLVHDVFVRRRYRYGNEPPPPTAGTAGTKAKKKKPKAAAEAAPAEAAAAVAGGGGARGGAPAWGRAVLTTALGLCVVAQRVAMNKGDGVMFDSQTNPASYAKSAAARHLTQLHY